MRSALFGVVLLFVVMVAGGALYQTLTAEPHLDPLNANAPATPNWALAAPAGVAANMHASLETPVWRATPTELIAALQQVALSEADTEIIAPPPGAFGAGEALAQTYRQRTKAGFPDYISVRALASGEEAASLAMFSRSVYGVSDRGVNRARLERWISKIDAGLARFR